MEEIIDMTATRGFEGHSKRLEILENSLKKKRQLFEDKLQNHFDTVKQTNGQPLNDKRNGRATLDKWDRQNDSLRNLQESIKKTEAAIGREKAKIEAAALAKEVLPSAMLALIESGELIQWRKHPNICFVAGVEKARIGWDEKKKIVYRKFSDQIKDQEQWARFRGIFNRLHEELNKK